MPKLDRILYKIVREKNPLLFPYEIEEEVDRIMYGVQFYEQAKNLLHRNVEELTSNITGKGKKSCPK